MKTSGKGFRRGMEWWEDPIDVDESDLISVPRPHPLPSSCSSSQTLPLSLHPCSQKPRSSQALDRNPSSPFQSQPPIDISERNRVGEGLNLPSTSTSRHLIPGPAGAIQAAMRRQSAVGTPQCPPFEAGGSDDVETCILEECEDFKLNPWLCALSFLGKVSGSSLNHPISSINANCNGTERIPEVIGIVKYCRPNGLITLKDPTGTIDASVHPKILSELNSGQKITLGCVFILKQVVAFRPARFQCYLNITLKNVVKLIDKDCGPPEKQISPPVDAMHGADGAEGNAKQLRTNPPAGDLPQTVRKAATVESSRRTFLPESLSGCINIVGSCGAQMNQPKTLISRTSVAEWTDEQLEKLFVEYEDSF